MAHVVSLIAIGVVSAVGSKIVLDMLGLPFGLLRFIAGTAISALQISAATILAGIITGGTGVQ